MANKIPNSAKIYKHVIVDASKIYDQVEIGDFSVVRCSILENNVRIDRYNQILNSSLGAFSYTGKNATVLHAKIGKFCSISWNSTLGGADHDYRRVCQHAILYDPRMHENMSNFVPLYDRYKEKLILGHDVWVGCGAFVKRGVKIGNGAVVGANSVVTKDVPSYAIVAGNPARILKYRFGIDKQQYLEDLRWWDWPKEKIRERINELSDIL